MRKRRIFLWIVPLSLVSLVLFQLTQSPKAESCAILHVTVIDVTGGEPALNQTVLITANRIIAMGETGQIIVPPGANVIDATGKFLIPGLWDMHVHILQRERHKEFFPLLIANGVTGIRDMGSPPDQIEAIKRLRKQIEEGDVLGPRIVAAGPMVDGPNPMFPELSVAVSNEAEARQTVRDLQSSGADFIKVYSLLPRSAYFALADEAKQRNIPFAGHVPESVSALEASDAGQRSIEHLSGVRLACSANETELRQKLVEARSKSDASLLYQALRYVYAKSRETYSEEKADALFARFVANDTWQVPTLVVARFVAQANSNPGEKTDVLQSNEMMNHNACAKGLTQDEFESVSTSAQSGFDLVIAMKRAGVKFMAGTDAPNPFVTPGPSLHDELELLVQAGFTPLEALQSATRNPAEYLGRLDRLGTIEEGKLADLVLLDANPIEDIRNARKIWAVVLNGKILLRPQLDELSLRDADQRRSGEFLKRHYGQVFVCFPAGDCPCRRGHR